MKEIIESTKIECGVDFELDGAVEFWDRVSGPRRAPAPISEGTYVGRVRRLLPEVPGLLGGKDGRLIEMGYNALPPKVMAEIWPDWLRYWNQVAPRPGAIGSSLNPSPRKAWFGFWRGLSIRECRALSLLHVGSALRVHFRKETGGVRPGEWADTPLVRYVPTPLPRKTRVRLARRVRAAMRTSWRGCPHLRLGADLGAFLGRLPPVWQAAAMGWINTRLPPASDGGPSYVRVRDVDWAAVREMAEAPDLKARWAREVWAILESPVFRDKLQPPALPMGRLLGLPAPAFPKLPLEMALRVCMGESPVQLSGEVLSRREAHEWCLEGAPYLESWLQERLLGGKELPPLRSIAVMRWLASVAKRGAWGQLTKARRMHGPAGLEAEVVLISKIDEIQEEDLVRGPRTGVEEAFEAASRRMEKALAGADDEVLCPVPDFKIRPRCMRWLRTTRQLREEGTAMRHCVAGYGPALRAGQSLILAINVRGIRSTVEMSPAGRIFQHRGPGNSEPDPVCQRALALFLKDKSAGEMEYWG